MVDPWWLLLPLCGLHLHQVCRSVVEVGLEVAQVEKLVLEVVEVWEVGVRVEEMAPVEGRREEKRVVAGAALAVDHLVEVVVERAVVT